MDPASRPRSLTFLLVFAGWATLAFLPAWVVSRPWQHALAAVASRVVAPRGAEIEMIDLQLFYPLDLAVFVALCLASGVLPWPRRVRAMAIGAPVMIAGELLALCVSMGLLMAVSAPGTSAARAEEAERMTDALLRVTGLALAAVVWFVLIGREQFTARVRR